MDNNNVILLLDEHNFIHFYNLKGKKIRGAAYELNADLVNLEELHKFKTDDRFLLFEEYQKTFNIKSLIILNSIGNIVYEPREDEYLIRVFPTKDKNKFLLNICKELDLESEELEVFCSILTVHPDPKKDIITVDDIEVSAPVYMCEEKLHYNSGESICSFYDIDNDILYIYYKPSFIKAIGGIVNNKIIDHFKVNVPDHFDFKDFAIFDKNLVIRDSDNKILNIDLSGTVSMSRLSNLLSFIGSNKHLHYYIFEDTDTSKKGFAPDFLGYTKGKSEDLNYIGIVKGFAVDYYNDITLPYYDCDGMSPRNANDYNLKLILVRDCFNDNLLRIYDLDKEDYIGKVDLSDVYCKIVNKNEPLKSYVHAGYFSLSFSKRWELILVRVDFSSRSDKIYEFIIDKFGNIIFSDKKSKEIGPDPEPEQHSLTRIINKDYSDIAFVNIIYSKYEIEINFYNNKGKPLYPTCNIKPEGEVNKVSKGSFSVYKGDVIAFCYDAFVKSEGEKEFTNYVTCIYDLKNNKLVRQLVDYSLSYYD